MEKRSITRILPLCAIVVTLLGLSGCNRPSETDSYQATLAEAVRSGEIYKVDPLFIGIYDYFERVKSLGPAITPLLEEGDLKLQYLESALLTFDPLAKESDRYRLAPLALDFGIAEPSIPNPGIPGSRYINGHIISGNFLELYGQLGGARYVGLPLTEARHNLEKGRVEQYFENIGFFREDDDESGKVRLMAYGVFACDRDCRYQAPPSSFPSLKPVLPNSLASQAARLGLGVTGLQLSKPTVGSDGQLEVVFENLVLATDPGLLSDVSLKPLVHLLNLQQGQPVYRKTDPLWIFIPTDGELGYSVPAIFFEFIQNYGGLVFSGLPTNQVSYSTEGTYQQCFTNLCMVFDPRNTEMGGLSLAPLGRSYLERNTPQPGDFYRTQSLADVKIKVWETEEATTSQQSQVVRVAIFDKDIPLMNREPIITLTLPDGRQVTYHFPPTDSSGHSSIKLPLINAPHFAIIPYEVCLLGITGDNVCEEDNFQIWNK